VHILEQFKQCHCKFTKFQTVLAIAARHGQIEVLQWFLELYGGIKYCYAITMSAVVAGRTDVLQWLKDNYPTPGWWGYEMYHYRRAIEVASLHGHISVVAWFMDNFKFSLENWPVPVDNAAAMGKLEMVKWFKEHCDEFTFSHLAVDRAALNGHLHVIRWFKESGCEFKYMRALYYATRKRRLDIIRWFKESGC
jgi:hypothetical protein